MMSFRYFGLVIILFFAVTMTELNQQVYSVNLSNEKEIFINQVGYLPEMPKWVATVRKATKFVIVQEHTAKIVYKGNLVKKYDPTSNQNIWRGEFTNLQIPGTYRVVIPGIGRSYPFMIKAEIYNKVFELGMRSYYLQRCGIALNDIESGLSHPACHCNDGTIAREDQFNKASELLPSCGGWHDAGDYGKYVTTTTVTVAQMLLALDLWPSKFNDGQFRIPESGNGIPDLLDEAKYGLEWLFKMQRPDGAVYHKIAGQFWAGFESPDQDIQKRFVYGISSADTAKFAATMAIAARVLRKRDPQLAEHAYDSALKAWNFLDLHPYIWDHNKLDDQGSGAYSLNTDSADRLWAALELSTLKIDEQINEEIRRQITEYQPQSISWSDSTVIGLFDYARSIYAKADLQKIAIDKVLALAKQYNDAAQISGYKYTLSYQDFLWASNKEALSRGTVMILADLLQPREHANPEFRRSALAQLDFVLGFNPLSKCFVCGLGTNTVTDLHHRFAVATGKTIPGLLAGGPNNLAESKTEPFGQGPFSYIDFHLSYSSNEPAIDYNAALIFVSAAFAN